MTNTETSTAREHRSQLRIFVNDQPYFAPEPVMTGAEILAMAGLPAANQLFLEVPGPADDRPVLLDERVKLHTGMKFYDVPVGTFG
jgi:hypothetical protein